jgi:hypothetical protein
MVGTFTTADLLTWAYRKHTGPNFCLNVSFDFAPLRSMSGVDRVMIDRLFGGMIDRLFGGRRLTCSTVVALTLSACTAKDPIDLPQPPAMSVAQFLARPTPAFADEDDEPEQIPRLNLGR